MSDRPSVRHFSAPVSLDGRKRGYLVVPFDPDEAWGEKTKHHVTGSIDGHGYRGVVEGFDGGFRIVLPPAWQRDCGVPVGEEVEVHLAPEGPQRDQLAPDVVAALDAEPEAGAFFDGLAQFYRKAYLTWIDATKRRPEVRAERIAEMVELLKAGVKQRPR